MYYLLVLCILRIVLRQDTDRVILTRFPQDLHRTLPVYLSGVNHMDVVNSI